MNLMSPPQFLWLFQTCETYCSDYFRLYNLKEAIDQLYTENWDNPQSYSGKQLSSKELYHHVACFVFNVKESASTITADPIALLHKNGYFMRCSIDIFDLEFSISNYLSIIECLMWAYLDKHIPYREISRVLGRSRPANDSEATLCQWINAIVSKHTPHLSQINVITKQFFSLPYFRVILFHYTFDDTLNNISDSSKNNAKICFDFCKKYNISLPFDTELADQPPLCILCFLCYVIVMLSKLPAKKKKTTVSDVAVVRKMNGIYQLRNEVNLLTKRCNKLNDEVNLYTKIVKSRPQSVMTKERVLRGPSFVAHVTPSTSSRSDTGPRIRWDPKIVEMAKIASTKAKYTFTSNYE